MVLALVLGVDPVVAQDYIIAGRPRPAAAGCGEDLSSDANLIGWWLLEEASGDRTDSSGNGNTLAEFDPTLGRDTTNFKEGAASLDLSGDWQAYLFRSDANVSAGFPGKSSGGDVAAFSVAFWWRPDATGCERFINKGFAADSWVIRTGCDSRAFSGSAPFSGDDCFVVSDATSTTASTWYHVVFIAPASGTCRLLIDGVEQADTASPTGTLGTTTEDFHVGGLDQADGRIDEFAIFDDELTNDQAQDIYNCGIDGAGLP